MRYIPHFIPGGEVHSFFRGCSMLEMHDEMYLELQHWQDSDGDEWQRIAVCRGATELAYEDRVPLDKAQSVVERLMSTYESTYPELFADTTFVNLVIGDSHA